MEFNKDWKLEKDMFGNNLITEDGFFLAEARDEKVAKSIIAIPEMFKFISEMAERYPNSPWIYEEANKIIIKITQ